MYKNTEGYSDTTAGEAIGNVVHQERSIRRKLERKRRHKIKSRPFVYVVSKFAGDVPSNVQNAKRYCRYAVSQKTIPIASHLLFPRFLNDNDAGERELGMLFGQALLAICKEVWVFGTDYSKGMKAEICEAERLSKTIRYFDERMEQINDNA